MSSLKKSPKRPRNNSNAPVVARKNAQEERDLQSKRFREAREAMINRAAGKFDHEDPEQLEGFGDSVLIAHRPGLEEMPLDRVKYRGVKATRSEIYSESSSEGEPESDGSDDSEEAESASPSRKRSTADKSWSNSDDVSDGDNSDDESFEAAALSESSDDEEDDGNSHHLMELLADQNDKELEKARHTANQKKIWDSLLGFRIKMQPLVAAANRFPSSDELDLLAKSSPKVSRALASLSTELDRSLNAFLAIQKSLARNSPELEGSFNSDEHDDDDDEDAAHNDDDQRLQRLWEKIERRQKSMEPYLFSVIDSWNARTALSSLKVSQGRFKALNQSIAVQLEQTLLNADRLKERATTKRTKGRILGSEESGEGAAATATAPNPELFDDTDFYQHMLRELLDFSKSADDPLEAGRDWVRIQNQSAKIRKNVDRKASKGRVLRYHTQEQLVNFMAPVELIAPPYTDRLFLELFGAK